MQMQWFKSKLGLTTSETRDALLSAPMPSLQKKELFDVPDALDDERFVNQLLAASNPQTRFYAVYRWQPMAWHWVCQVLTYPTNLSVEQQEVFYRPVYQGEMQPELRRNFIDES